MTARRFVLFGDSVMAGFHDPEGGWFERLRAEARDEHEFYNCAVSGETTEDLGQYFETELTHRLSGSMENHCVIGVGVNDAISGSEGELRVEPDRTSENMREIIEVSQRKADGTTVILPLKVDFELTQPVDFDEDVFYREEDFWAAREAVESACSDLGVDTVSPDSSGRWIDTLRDGVHPGPSGHKIIKNRVSEQLEI